MQFAIRIRSLLGTAKKAYSFLLILGAYLTNWSNLSRNGVSPHTCKKNNVKLLQQNNQKIK